MVKGDKFTSFGAGTLASTIEAYWKGEGHNNVVAERYEIPEMPGMFGVRSNLVNGLPPKAAWRGPLE